METLVLIGLIAAILLLLVGLAVLIRIVEILFPAFSRFLDERVGEEPDWTKPF